LMNFDYLLYLTDYQNFTLLLFDDFCPILSLRVGKGVGKNCSHPAFFESIFSWACGEEPHFFLKNHFVRKGKGHSRHGGS
jgi:hypothetical protein